MMYVLWIGGIILGFALLVKGADFFVDGAASIARKMGISAAIVGLTIVAMGTSAPEAAVSLTTGVQAGFFGNVGATDTSVGNILGSNLFNLLFILGICMMIKPIPTFKESLTRDFPWAIGTTVLFIPMIMDGKLALYEGIILLTLFFTYIGWLIYKSIKNRVVVADETKKLSAPKSIFFLLLGLVMIIAGSQFVVNCAEDMAIELGMSPTIVGLTICAIGTSLPELVTSMVAARKGESELAVGNVIGSNIFNLLFILGGTICICSPGLEGFAMQVDLALMVDTIVLLTATAMMLLFSFTGKKCGRIEGVVSFSGYIGYTVFIILREFGMLVF
jgi:cation:H+ antiporter